jgi:3'-5' exoribonuclease
VLGSRIVSERAAGVLDDARLLPLLHCVLGHHGPASLPGGRFGSAEAVALYRLNALDTGVKEALEHGLGG